MALKSSSAGDVAAAAAAAALLSSTGCGGGGVARSSRESTLDRRRLGAAHDQSAEQQGYYAQRGESMRGLQLGGWCALYLSERARCPRDPSRQYRCPRLHYSRIWLGHTSGMSEQPPPRCLAAQLHRRQVGAGAPGARQTASAAGDTEANRWRKLN